MATGASFSLPHEVDNKCDAVTEAGESPMLRPTEADAQQQLPFSPAVADAPLCAECGSIMTRNGSCYKCGNCGGTSGCS